MTSCLTFRSRLRHTLGNELPRWVCEDVEFKMMARDNNLNYLGHSQIQSDTFSWNSVRIFALPFSISDCWLYLVIKLRDTKTNTKSLSTPRVLNVPGLRLALRDSSSSAHHWDPLVNSGDYGR
jgi:hypothetical protein